RYGREGLGILWIIAEPAMFILGVMVIFPFIDTAFRGSTVAEYLAVSYPTLLLWRNGTNRVTKAIEVNRALLHHRPIRPIDIILSRVCLEFTSATATFLILYLIFIVVGICHWPNNVLTMTLGYLLVVWFSFGFVMIMAALAELSESIEKVSHIILYLMLPFSGVFIPAYLIPEPYRNYVLLFPLVDCVEYFHHGYFGSAMPTYYYLNYTMAVNLALTFVGLSLTAVAINRVQTS
ncbi:ABC transporter permease, partial [Acidithiobacillus ferrooxidans]|uniref:ABC transporter permease n=2 Tax=Acidithiobacillus ferrooxidans TaxID=920 RepID=UPI0021495904